MSSRSSLAFICLLALAACAPPEQVGVIRSAEHACSAPMDSCDDGDICTTDQCEIFSGTCQHIPIANCCTTVDDCEPRICQRVTGCEPDDSAITVCIYQGILGCQPDAGVDGGAVTDAATPDAGALPDAAADGGELVEDGGSGSGDAGDSVRDGAMDDAGDGEPTPQVRGGACSAAGGGPGLAAGFLLLLVLTLRRRPALLAFAILCSTLASTASAQSFRLSPDAPTVPDDLSLLERAAPASSRLRPALRIAASYEDDPLVALVGDDERALIGERLGLSLAAGAAFLDRVHVALRAGLVVQGGAGAAGVDAAQPALTSVALASPALDGRVTLLDREDPLELALAATLRFPVGSGDAFARDSGVSVWPRVLLARELDDRGSFVGLSLGVDVRPRATLGDLRIGSLWTFALGGAVGVGRRSAITLEVAGATVLARAFDGSHTPLRASAGIRWASDAITVHAWGGFGLSLGFGTPDALFGLALGWRLPVELSRPS